MSFHKRSFLTGLTVGRTLKGWSGGTAETGLAPVCWNDPGVYDRFYIDYGSDLGAFSYGRFCNKTTILGGAGEIVPTDAAALDGRRVCVFADLTGQTRVRVYGNGKVGLPLFDGREAPAWAAEFWVDGEAPHELPYAADSIALTLPAPWGEEAVALAHSPCAAAAMADGGALGAVSVAAAEAAGILYS